MEFICDNEKENWEPGDEATHTQCLVLHVHCGQYREQYTGYTVYARTHTHTHTVCLGSTVKWSINYPIPEKHSPHAIIMVIEIACHWLELLKAIGQLCYH